MLLRSWQRTLLLVATSAVATACKDLDAPVRSPIGEQRLKQAVSRVVRPTEKAQVEMAKLIPGFGGYYFTRSGDLVTNVTDLAQVAVAKSYLDPILRSHRLGRVQRTLSVGRSPSLSIRHVPFSFLQLAAWRDSLFGPLFASHGVYTLGINVAQNDILVGVDRRREALMRVFVQRTVNALRIPVSAVVIYATSGLARNARVAVGREGDTTQLQLPDTASACWSFTSRDTTTRDYNRPLEGGLVLCFPTSSGRGECTIGFVTGYGSGSAFVTAGHCNPSGVAGSAADSTMYYQPTVSVGADSVGRVVWDQSFLGLTCPTNYALLGYKCRYSDTRLVSTFVDAAVGRIARTTPGAYPDYLYGWWWINRHAAIYNYFVVSGDSIPEVGDEVFLMGAESPFYYGYNQLVSFDVYAPQLNTILLSQSLADYAASDGDSGGPIFAWPDTPPYDQYVLMEGIENGAVDQPPGLDCSFSGQTDPRNGANLCSVFSSIANIQMDNPDIVTH